MRRSVSFWICSCIFWNFYLRAAFCAETRSVDGFMGVLGGTAARLARGTVLLRCADRPGLLTRLSGVAAAGRANVDSCELHVDPEAPGAPEFIARAEFTYEPAAWPEHSLRADFARLGHELGGMQTVLLDNDTPKRMGILASRSDHCILELLHRWEERELSCHVACVVSNHRRPKSSPVLRFLERTGVPHYYLPVAARPGGEAHAAHELRPHEEAILAITSSTDFLVLARYMQVLSGAFLRAYGKDIINIHHGLLPSFKGANPYRQAQTAGVKLVGATAHFVSEELDAGPIIDQAVERVSHRDTLRTYRQVAQNLERTCLVNSVQRYLEGKVLRISRNRTAVFS